MTKEESKKVKLGDILNLVDISPTPGRIFHPIIGGEVRIKGIYIENGYNHFDIGTVMHNEAAIKSRDTGEILDGSDIYWLHPSRFEFIK